MSELKPHFTILIDERRREVHFAASGFWSPDHMARFQAALLEKSKPLYSKGIAFNVLGDLSGLAVQDRMMADAMKFMLQESTKLGMRKLAMVITAPLVKMQYARLAEGANTEIFTNRGDAVAWLRSQGT
ncbi:MAG: hypothetical protein AAF559_10770 [Pseudomonadota bacterium]